MNGSQGRAKGRVQIGTKRRIMTGQPRTGRAQEGFWVKGQGEKKEIMGCRNRLAMVHPVNHRELRGWCRPCKRAWGLQRLRIV